MSKPMECPFCHSVNSYYEVDEWDMIYVKCYSCNAQGPKVKTARGANFKAKSPWMKAVKAVKL